MKMAREFDEVIGLHPFLLFEFDDPNPFINEILQTGEVIRVYSKF